MFVGLKHKSNHNYLLKKVFFLIIKKYRIIFKDKLMSTLMSCLIERYLFHVLNLFANLRGSKN